VGYKSDLYIGINIRVRAPKGSFTRETSSYNSAIILDKIFTQIEPRRAAKQKTIDVFLSKPAKSQPQVDVK